MTFMIERLSVVYSVNDGDKVIWRKVRGQPDGKPLTWNTRREAEGFSDLLLSKAGNEYRVVEVENVR